MVGNCVVNTCFKVIDTSMGLSKFVIDAAVLDIRNRDVIWRSLWVTENGFSLDTQKQVLRNIDSGQVIPCSVKCILGVLIIEEEQLKDSKILLIIATSE